MNYNNNLQVGISLNNNTYYYKLINTHKQYNSVTPNTRYCILFTLNRLFENKLYIVRAILNTRDAIKCNCLKSMV